MNGCIHCRIAHIFPFSFLLSCVCREPSLTVGLLTHVTRPEACFGIIQCVSEARPLGRARDTYCEPSLTVGVPSRNRALSGYKSGGSSFFVWGKPSGAITSSFDVLLLSSSATSVSGATAELEGGCFLTFSLSFFSRAFCFFCLSCTSCPITPHDCGIKSHCTSMR